MAIKSYGLNWNPELIDWDNKTIKGKSVISNQNTEEDFWDGKGIYILEYEFKPVYVGKAVGNNVCLGTRLNHHYNKNNKAGKWDMFSFFEIENEVSKTFNLTNTIEAYTIIAFNLSLNKKNELAPLGKRYYQNNNIYNQTIRSQLNKLSEELKELKAILKQKP